VVVPLGLWKCIRTQVVQSGRLWKWFRSYEIQFLPSKKVWVDLKGGKTAGVNGPSPSQWKKTKKFR